MLEAISQTPAGIAREAVDAIKEIGGNKDIHAAISRCNELNDEMTSAAFVQILREGSRRFGNSRRLVK